ncbi:MAG: 5'-nucleotidase C-terminal domain-containing protein [Clostridia bacterium]|nr:5'-nucleotidase C-terminal domain-containing protein [Clostridia bacterium]
MLRKRLLAVMCAIAIVLTAFPAATFAAEAGDIVILFESDVHCAVNGYTKLAALRNEAKQQTEYVSVVSCGDFVQGGSLGAASDGAYIIEIMNAVGYDVVTLGNHEFDYTIPTLATRMEELDAKVVSCNFVSTDNGRSIYDPYTIISYGDTDVAFIGITTPESISKATPTYFMDEDGNYIYDFCADTLYERVQDTIDSAIADGADYVVALSHLGTEYVTEEWTAQEVAAHTSGLDVMLDGHSHSVIESDTIPDMNGEDVLICSVGTQFEYIGTLTIASDGTLSTKLTETASYEGEDEAVSKVVSDIEAEYAAMGDRVVGTSSVTLTMLDENGVRAVRNAETNIGDFCADAYRAEFDADIGIMNGGGMRADIAAGDVTYNDILAMIPYGNLTCCIEVSGQAVLDMLEHSVKGLPSETGGFLQVSGIKFDVDASIESPVTLDENDLFTGVTGERRVSNVQVQNRETGEYEPLDVNATYTIASIEYLLIENGSGYTMFGDAVIIDDREVVDTQTIEDYIAALGGTIGEEYAKPQGRINILQYVPLRATFEALGYTVSWYADNPYCAFVTIGDVTITFTDKSAVISADGTEVELSLETYMEDGVTYMSSDAVELCEELTVK